MLLARDPRLLLVDEAVAGMTVRETERTAADRFPILETGRKVDEGRIDELDDEVVQRHLSVLGGVQ